MTVDVKARLVLDDAASAAVGKLRAGFGELLTSSTAVNTGLGVVSQTLGTMAGMYLPQLISQVTAFATGLLDAARAGDAADQALAGFMSVAQGRGFADARKEAEGINDELDEMAIGIGQPIQQVGDAYMRLVEITGASAAGIADSKKRLHELTVISNVLGKDTQAIAQEYGFMTEGMLRARSPLAQLLQSTGIFGDNIKKAGAGWAQLTEEERMKRLSYGIAQVADKLGEAEPTFNDILTMISNTKEMALEKFGEPIMKALKPELKEFAEMLDRDSGAIEEYAGMVAGDLRDAVHAGGEAFRDGVQYLKTHHEEIRDAVKDAFAFAKSVVEFVIEHKEVLALAFGAKAAMPAIQGAAQAGQAVYGAGKAVYGVGAAGTGTFGVASGQLVGVAGGATALAAFSAAVIGVGLAAYEATMLAKDLKENSEANSNAQLSALRRVHEGQAMFSSDADQMVEWIGRMDEALVLSARDLGLSVQEIHRYTASLKAEAETRAAVADVMSQAGKLANISFEGQREKFLAAEEVEANLGIVAGDVVYAWELAGRAHDESAKQYIVGMLLGSKNLSSAFIQASDMTTEGYAALLEAVTKGGGAMSDFAKQLKGLVGESGKMEKPSFNLNMNGGQTFKIQQEFRDADPDRIAMVFRRDIVASAERRIHSGYSSPFGT